jgi:hypothetical protein
LKIKSDGTRYTRCEINQLERKDSIAAVTKVMKDDVAEVLLMKMEHIETETIERVNLF